jgi:hypothetical protein
MLYLRLLKMSHQHNTNAIDMAYSILFETKLTFHTSKIIILLDLTVFLILNYNFT